MPRETVSMPSAPLGFENTKSVMNSVPGGVNAGWLVSRRPSTGLPRPGMVTVGEPDGAGDAAPPLGDALPEAPDGAGEAPPPPPPALASGAIVGRPAAPSASLTSALRLASGEATASVTAESRVGSEQQHPDQDEGDQQHDQREQRLQEPRREHGFLEERAVDSDRGAALGRDEQLERTGLRLSAPEPLDGADPDLGEARHPGLDDDARRLDVELELAVGVGALDPGVQACVAAVVDGEVMGPGA